MNNQTSGIRAGPPGAAWEKDTRYERTSCHPLLPGAPAGAFPPGLLARGATGGIESAPVLTRLALLPGFPEDSPEEGSPRESKEPISPSSGESYLESLARKAKEAKAARVKERKERRLGQAAPRKADGGAPARAEPNPSLRICANGPGTRCPWIQGRTGATQEAPQAGPAWGFRSSRPETHRPDVDHLHDGA